MIQRIRIDKNLDVDLVAAFITRFPSDKADDLLVEFIAHQMRDRLSLQRDKGFKGWNTPQCENKDLIERAEKNIKEGDYLDAINLLAMVLARRAMFEEVEYKKKGE